MSDFVGRGWLPPGFTATNDTGKPERVLTPAQAAALRALRRMDEPRRSDAHLLARLALRRARRLAVDVTDRLLRCASYLMGHG
ncbi:MAG: hypothetical protein NVSMB4_09060 [Acidimicrobiales bacterium]